MTRYAGLVEYDGAGFAGWAIQPGMRTVEGELARALSTVLRQPVKLSVAGRTDAGVHACGQVVSFDARTEIPAPTISYKATAVLPEDLALRRCIVVSQGFDARRDARSRSYEYRVVNDPARSPLLRQRALYVPGRLDLDLLDECAGLVRGTHDFRAFTPSRTYHVRFERVVTESGWSREGDSLAHRLAHRLAYRITADSFLYGMVRALVGTMLEVAMGKRELASFRAAMQAGERSEAGTTVAARGLTLTAVGYDDPELWNGEGGQDG